MVRSDLPLISFRSILKQETSPERLSLLPPPLSLFLFWSRSEAVEALDGKSGEERNGGDESKYEERESRGKKEAGEMSTIQQVACSLLTTEEAVMRVWRHCHFYGIGS